MQFNNLSVFRACLVLVLLAGHSSAALAVERELGEFIASPATLALTFYKRFLSPAKGTSCPMEPSDSTYSRQAIERHGLFRGALMTADRLHRCGHDGLHYPLVRTPRGLKYFDPVDPSDPAP